MNIQLDARLKAIFDMVEPGSVVADIGCDHAHLACALAESDRARHVFACEANLKPLENAKKTIEENCLSDSIDTILTNGLTDLPHESIDTFIIAGMGGELIGQILLSHTWVRNTRFKFILNPMTREKELRELLLKNGFTIKKELCISCDNRVYIVMFVIYTNRICDIDEIYYYTGCNIYNNDFSSQQYIDTVITRLEKKLKGLKMSKTVENMEKAIKYENLIDKINNTRIKSEMKGESGNDI